MSLSNVTSLKDSWKFLIAVEDQDVSRVVGQISQSEQRQREAGHREIRSAYHIVFGSHILEKQKNILGKTKQNKKKQLKK